MGVIQPEGRRETSDSSLAAETQLGSEPSPPRRLAVTRVISPVAHGNALPLPRQRHDLDRTAYRLATRRCGFGLGSRAPMWAAAVPPYPAPAGTEWSYESTVGVNCGTPYPHCVWLAVLHKASAGASLTPSRIGVPRKDCHPTVRKNRQPTVRP